MHKAVIVSTARSAIGTAFKGSLLDVDAFEVQLISLGGGNFDIVYRYQSINGRQAKRVEGRMV